MMIFLQGVSFLQPVYTITDPYLNLFRGLIPPLGGLDLSPIVAFFTLNVLSSTTASIGCEIPDSKSSVGVQSKRKVQRPNYMNKPYHI
jgi:YggT family protein